MLYDAVRLAEPLAAINDRVREGRQSHRRTLWLRLLQAAIGLPPANWHFLREDA
jgi:hypothetical protein